MVTRSPTTDHCTHCAVQNFFRGGDNTVLYCTVLYCTVLHQRTRRTYARTARKWIAHCTHHYNQPFTVPFTMNHQSKGLQRDSMPQTNAGPANLPQYGSSSSSSSSSSFVPLLFLFLFLFYSSFIPLSFELKFDSNSKSRSDTLAANRSWNLLSCLIC